MSEQTPSGALAINKALIETPGQTVPEEPPTVGSFDIVASEEGEARPDQAEEQIPSRERWFDEFRSKAVEKRSKNKVFAKHIGNIALRRAEGDLTTEPSAAQNHKQAQIARKLHNKTHKIEEAISKQELLLGKSNEPLGGPRRVATFKHRRALKKEAKSEYKQGEISSFEYAKQKKVAKYSTVNQLSETQKKAKSDPVDTKAELKKFGEKLGGTLEIPTTQNPNTPTRNDELIEVKSAALEPRNVLALRQVTRDRLDDADNDFKQLNGIGMTPEQRYEKYNNLLGKVLTSFLSLKELPDPASIPSELLDLLKMPQKDLEKIVMDNDPEYQPYVRQAALARPNVLSQEPLSEYDLLVTQLSVDIGTRINEIKDERGQGFLEKEEKDEIAQHVVDEFLKTQAGAQYAGEGAKLLASIAERGAKALAEKKPNKRKPVQMLQKKQPNKQQKTSNK